jgi:hypothetical protein
MNPSEQESPQPRGFVPLLLIALAVITVEVGDIISLRIEKHSLLTQVEQLESASQISHKADARMASLMASLVGLAETDSDARTVVDRHGVRQPPAGGANR